MRMCLFPSSYLTAVVRRVIGVLFALPVPCRRRVFACVARSPPHCVFVVVDSSLDGLECLRDLLKYNTSQNIRLVVDVAKRYSEQLTPKSLIALFEEFDSSSGLYYYLGSFVNYTEVRYTS